MKWRWLPRWDWDDRLVFGAPSEVKVLVSYRWEKVSEWKAENGAVPDGTGEPMIRGGYGDWVLELDRFPEGREKIEEIRRWLIDNTPGEVDFVVIIAITRLET